MEENTINKPLIESCIESISNGFISGWAYDKSNINEPIDITIYLNNQEIAKGKADKYRIDLEEAGIGNGVHAFHIPIMAQITKEEESNIEIKETKKGESATLLDSSIKSISIPKNNIFKQQFYSKGSVIVFSFGFHAQAKKTINITISIDDSIILEQPWDGVSQEVSGDCLIPSKYLDGNSHVIKARLNNQTVAINAIITPFNYTPWEYIEGNDSVIKHSSLDNIGAYRYESLLENFNNISDVNQVAQLNIAHSNLVKGYNKLKTYQPLTFPKVSDPTFSIIIPVHNKFNLTYHCLSSILFAPNKASYEIIVVDDCSTDKTTKIKDFASNINVVVNKENLGFLKSCNKAANHAKGKYVLFLNNDTEVTKFWLDELLWVFDNQENAGLVGSKLINKDGTLQEAGGIVWQNGNPWNVGNGENTYQPAFNYIREADYVSGASMAISKKDWDEVGGFSLEYAPAYYEDTDLAFKVRQIGKKVFYTPFSQVIHFEGMSNGRDITKGVKKHQKINEKTFKKKWAKVFKNHGAEGSNFLKEIDRNKTSSILVIDYQTPQLNKDAGSYAAIEEIKLLLALGFKVTFIPENMAFQGSYTYHLQKLGVEVIHAPFAGNVNEIILSRGKEFDAVYITRYNVASNYVDTIRKNSNAKIIFNNADLHFLRELRSALQFNKDLSDPLATRDKELSLMREVDVILSYNEVEHAVILSHNLKEDNIFLCPWVIGNKLTPKKFSDRENIVFLGNFNHPPNKEAVEYMANKVMPKLAESGSDIKLEVYGANINDDIYEFECDNIFVKGYAENLIDVFSNAKIFIAPLISGAGIKGKVLESMAHGVPTILTPVAAEGTKLTNKISTLIARNPNQWVESINKLNTDEALWNKIRDNAIIITEEEFSFEKGKERFREAFESVDIFV